MTVRALQKQIHVACRQLGLDADARHDLQLAACGKTSMREMDEANLTKVLTRLKDLGWTTGYEGQGKRRGHKSAPRADLRFVHVLWRKLGTAGALRDPSRAGLNAFVRSRFEGGWQSVPIDIDALRDHRKINDVITALKDWCAREGVELSR